MTGREEAPGTATGPRGPLSPPSEPPRATRPSSPPSPCAGQSPSPSQSLDEHLLDAHWMSIYWTFTEHSLVLPAFSQIFTDFSDFLGRFLANSLASLEKVERTKLGEARFIIDHSGRELMAQMVNPQSPGVVPGGRPPAA